jgi:hypothetical protein
MTAAKVLDINQTQGISDGKKPPQKLAANFRRFSDAKSRRKVCDQRFTRGFKNRRKYSVLAVFLAFPAVFGRRK